MKAEDAAQIVRLDAVVALMERKAEILGMRHSRRIRERNADAVGLGAPLVAATVQAIEPLCRRAESPRGRFGRKPKEAAAKAHTMRRPGRRLAREREVPGDHQLPGRTVVE